MIAKKDIRNKTENAFKPSDINGFQTLSCCSYMEESIAKKLCFNKITFFLYNNISLCSHICEFLISSLLNGGVTLLHSVKKIIKINKNNNMAVRLSGGRKWVK